MKFYSSLKMMLAGLALLALPAVSASAHSDPVNGSGGWSSIAVNWDVQWPYNLSESSRYAIESGPLYHTWVYNTDAPFQQGSSTLPRTEQRFTNNYSSGEIQYASDMMVPSDTDACCIFQIHTIDSQESQFGSTAMMIFWYAKNGGSVFQHSGTQLVTGLVGQYFHVNVDHNLNNRLITIWINQTQVWQHADNGASSFYMKDGVYMQTGGSTKMENHIKNIKMWHHS